MIDRDQRLERKKLLAEQQHVPLLDSSDGRAITRVGELKRLVELRQPLIEPDRQAIDAVVEDEMNVLVIDDPEVVQSAFERESDVVDRRGRLKGPPRRCAPFPDTAASTVRSSYVT
jgi:hypothetical protein